MINVVCVYLFFSWLLFKGVLVGIGCFGEMVLRLAVFISVVLIV